MTGWVRRHRATLVVLVGLVVAVVVVALSTRGSATTARLDPDNPDPAGAQAVARVLAAPELVVTRQRKGKDVTDDIRPYLLDLAVIGPTDAGTRLHAHLATQPRGLRIGELVAVLGVGEEGSVRRTHQWTLVDGARTEPLDAAAEATSTPLVEHRRAS